MKMMLGPFVLRLQRLGLYQILMLFPGLLVFSSLLLVHSGLAQGRVQSISADSKFLATTTQEYVVRKRVLVEQGDLLPEIKLLRLTDLEADKYRDNGYSVDRNTKFNLFGFFHDKIIFKTDPSWGVQAVQSSAANLLPGGSGEGVVVCVVDSGADLNQPALADQTVGGENFSDQGKADDLSDGMGHGTFVAGVIGGRVLGQFRGVAPKAKLFISKVYSKSGVGSLFSISKGIQACVNNSNIINLSLGSSKESQVITDVIRQAQLNGVSVVAAAGNSSPVAFPARVSGVIAVGAVDSSLSVPSFSARGIELSYVAPGVGILGPCPLGYKIMSGTSVSAAFTSGVEAIRLSRKNALIKAMDLGRPLTDQGQGLVDAFKTAQ